LNDSITVFPSGAYVNDQNSRDLDNAYAAGVHLVLNITASGVNGSNVSFIVEGKAEHSETYYTILQSAALTLNGPTVIKIYPGLAASANVSVNDHLPRIWRVRADHSSSTDAINYSVDGSYLT
jgi:hypothetical protein